MVTERGETDMGTYEVLVDGKVFGRYSFPAMASAVAWELGRKYGYTRNGTERVVWQEEPTEA